MHFLEKLRVFENTGLITKDIFVTLNGFYHSYERAIQANGGNVDDHVPLLNTFLDHVSDQIKNPFDFGSFHEKLVDPFDFYHFGLDFLRPVVKLDKSTIFGEENISKIEELLRLGENVVLFSNHQTEPDPQAISLLLEDSHKELSQNMIFVAGHRVTTDPLAVPFSKGRNLLCIYSKKYVEHPPENRLEKVRHNQKTMKKMLELLSLGGKCIYVAPSGGRDRPNKQGIVEVAPFDPQSIEMFWFTAKHASKPTHFFPLALFTFDLLPPPDDISIALGESRQTRSSPIHLAFGEEIGMSKFADQENLNKKELRSVRAHHIWNLVNDLYKKIAPNKS